MELFYTLWVYTWMEMKNRLSDNARKQFIICFVLWLMLACLFKHDRFFFIPFITAESEFRRTNVQMKWPSSIYVYYCRTLTRSYAPSRQDFSEIVV